MHISHDLQVTTRPDGRRRVLTGVRCRVCSHIMATLNPPTCPINYCTACGRDLGIPQGIQNYVNPNVLPNGANLE